MGETMRLSFLWRARTRFRDSRENNLPTRGGPSRSCFLRLQRWPSARKVRDAEGLVDGASPRLCVRMRQGGHGADFVHVRPASLFKFGEESLCFFRRAALDRGGGRISTLRVSHDLKVLSTLILETSFSLLRRHALSLLHARGQNLSKAIDEAEHHNLKAFAAARRSRTSLIEQICTRVRACVFLPKRLASRSTLTRLARGPPRHRRSSMRARVEQQARSLVGHGRSDCSKEFLGALKVLAGRMPILGERPLKVARGLLKVALDLVSVFRSGRPASARIAKRGM